jgi:hypothetical protein
MLQCQYSNEGSSVVFSFHINFIDDREMRKTMLSGRNHAGYLRLPQTLVAQNDHHLGICHGFVDQEFEQGSAGRFFCTTEH